MAAAGIVFLVYFGTGTLAAIHIIPRTGPLGNDFGAINITYGLSLLFFPPIPMTDATIVAYRMPIFFDLAFAGMIVLALALAVRATKTYSAALQKISPAHLALLLAGALVITTCFFLAQNISYRESFLLFALPGVFALKPTATTRKLIAALVFIMWEQFIHSSLLSLFTVALPSGAAYGLDMLYWLAREVIWWWVIIQFLAIIFAYFEATLRTFAGLPTPLDAAAQKIDDVTVFTVPAP